MMPARCKLAYIIAGIIAITGRVATGLISVEKVSNNPDEDCRIQEDIAADLPPHLTRLGERPREHNLNRLSLFIAIHHSCLLFVNC
jgi:hypothetical protein